MPKQASNKLQKRSQNNERKCAVRENRRMVGHGSILRGQLSGPVLWGGCRGQDEQEVFAELCEIVEETIDLYKKEGKPLPPPTSGKDYANKMVAVA